MRPLRTAVIGLGDIAQGYAKDASMAAHLQYATHAQVLKDHPSFSWEIGVDPVAARRQEAQRDWGVPTSVARVHDLSPTQVEAVEVVVMATPPDARPNLPLTFPNLRAILVEKPIGLDIQSPTRFVKSCQASCIPLQVNLWRRADPLMRRLMDGLLHELVGDVQATFGVYGKGLRNNGIHIVDLARMLLGEVQSVERLPSGATAPEHSTSHLGDPAFFMSTVLSPTVSIMPLQFRHYRENGLIIWGTKGRLEILNEGLVVRSFSRHKNRAMTGEYEIASDVSHSLEPTAGQAMFQMYTNLAEAVLSGAPLYSSGESALRSTQIVEDVLADASRVSKSK